MAVLCPRKKSILVSFVLVFFSHFALAMVPFSFSLPFSSLLVLSALILVAATAIGRFCRWFLDVSASAPALVFFNILFIWGIYISTIPEGVPSLKDVGLTLEFVMLIIGFYRILSSDPGIVRCHATHLYRLHQTSVPIPNIEGEELLTSHASLEPPPIEKARRVRYCDSCEAHIMGFDHHCPAFGNCIGQQNHPLFMAVLIGFIIVEANYAVCAYQCMLTLWYTDSGGSKNNFSLSFVVSTLFFSFLQLLWQVPFLTWHIYCICSNIKTDEWINWRKYPEFHCLDRSQLGQSFPEVRFRNPYDKGVISNIKEFMQWG